MNNANTLNEQNKSLENEISPGFTGSRQQTIFGTERGLYKGFVSMAEGGGLPPDYPSSANEIYQEKRLDIDKKLIDLAKKVYDSNNVERAKHLVRLVSKHYENSPADLLSFSKFDDLEPEQNEFVRGLAKAALSSIADKKGWDVYSNSTDPLSNIAAHDIYKGDLTDMKVLNIYTSNNKDLEGFQNNHFTSNQTNNLGTDSKGTYALFVDGVDRQKSGLTLDGFSSQPKSSLYEFDSMGEGIALNHPYSNHTSVKGKPEQYFSRVTQKDKK